MSALPALEARSLSAEQLPWSRALATRRWVQVFAALAAGRLVLLAALPTFTSVPLGELADDLAFALLFPALFLAVVLYCERRFLRRPPKAVLAMQLGCFCAGALLQGAAMVAAPRLAPLAMLVLSGSTLLLGSWFLGVLLVPED